MKIKISKIRQLMGQLVIVDKVSEQRSDPPNREVIAWRPKYIKPRCGWVVGVRWYRAVLYTSAPLTKTGWTWKQTGPAVPLLLVVFWPTQNPVKVPMDGWRRRSVLPELINPDPLPWDGQWDEYNRAVMSRAATRCKRDERGRFV